MHHRHTEDQSMLHQSRCMALYLKARSSVRQTPSFSSSTHHCFGAEICDYSLLFIMSSDPEFPEHEKEAFMQRNRSG